MPIFMKGSTSSLKDKNFPELFADHFTQMIVYLTFCLDIRCVCLVHFQSLLSWQVYRPVKHRIYLTYGLQTNHNDILSCFQVSRYDFSWLPMVSISQNLPCAFCRDYCTELGSVSLCSCFDKLPQGDTLSPTQHQSRISYYLREVCSETPNVTRISWCYYMQHSTLVTIREFW